jgi:hypothetical protein
MGRREIFHTFLLLVAMQSTSMRLTTDLKKYNLITCYLIIYCCLICNNCFLFLVKFTIQILQSNLFFSFSYGGDRTGDQPAIQGGEQQQVSVSCHTRYQASCSLTVLYMSVSCHTTVFTRRPAPNCICISISILSY